MLYVRRTSTGPRAALVHRALRWSGAALAATALAIWPQAAVANTSEVREPVPVCTGGYGPPGDEGYSEEGFLQSHLNPTNCMYQPAANGVARLNASRVKLYSDVQVTFLSGTQSGSPTHLLAGTDFIGYHRLKGSPGYVYQIRLRQLAGECYVPLTNTCTYEVEPFELQNYAEGFYVIPVEWASANPLNGVGAYDVGLYVGEHNPPAARFTVEHVKGLTYKFDATSSTDEVRVSTFQFTVGGTPVSVSPIFEYTFPRAGTYNVGLTVEDEAGLSDKTAQEILVPEPAPSPGPGPGPGVPAPAGGGASSSINYTQLAVLLSEQLLPAGKAAKILALIKSGVYLMKYAAPEGGMLVVNWYQVPLGATLARKAKPVLVATGQRSFPAAGTGTIRIELTAAGRKLLKHAKLLRLTAKGMFTPSGMTPITTKRTFVVNR